MPKVTGHQLRQAHAEAVRRFGRDVSVSVTPGGAGIGTHGEYVLQPRRERQGKPAYWCDRCGREHFLRGRRDSYTVSRTHGGSFNFVLGGGFSFAAAFRQAVARLALRDAHLADVQLPRPKKGVRTSQERRTRARSTFTIPPSRRVTGQQRKRCQDCKTPITTRTRCNRCALRHWRLQHPTVKRLQDQRYRAKRPAKVRALVRKRVARWRKRHKQTHKRVGS